MTRKVFGTVLPFAVLKVSRFHDNPYAVRASPCAVGAHVLHPYHRRMRNLARSRRTPITPNIADDHSPIPKLELSAVILTDPNLLDEAESRSEPRYGLAHIGIDQNRDDRCRRDRAIEPHSAD
jgi:hypothetical protein